MSGDVNVTISENDTGYTVIDDFSLPVDSIKWLDNGQELSFEKKDDKLIVQCTPYRYVTNLTVRVAKISLKN